MNNHFVLILLVMSKLVGAQNDSSYEALDITVLNRIEEDKRTQIDKAYQLSYNKAFVTIFKDNTSILFPGNGGGQGLFYKDVLVMDKMIEERKFPVKGDGSFWEQEKERMIKLDSSMQYYIDTLSEILKFRLKISLDSEYLKQLSGVINDKLKHKANKNLLNYLSIYFAELIRVKNNGHWQLLPRYTLNIYYIPEIVVRDTYCSPWLFLQNDLKMHPYQSLDVLLMLETAEVFSPLAKDRYK